MFNNFRENFSLVLSLFEINFSHTRFFTNDHRMLSPLHQYFLVKVGQIVNRLHRVMDMVMHLHWVIQQKLVQMTLHFAVLYKKCSKAAAQTDFHLSAFLHSVLLQVFPFHEHFKPKLSNDSIRCIRTMEPTSFCFYLSLLSFFTCSF
jgi:hypothetical protein